MQLLTCPVPVADSFCGFCAPFDMDSVEAVQTRGNPSRAIAANWLLILLGRIHRSSARKGESTPHKGTKSTTDLIHFEEKPQQFQFHGPQSWVTSYSSRISWKWCSNTVCCMSKYVTGVHVQDWQWAGSRSTELGQGGFIRSVD